MSLHNSSGQAGRSKVAIPKLVQKRPDAPRKAAVSRLNRVNRACLSCRSRKIKCNGARPSCFNCQDNGTTCVYASSRKDRLKTATGQNQDMIELLRELREQVTSQGQNRIDGLLALVVDDVADASASLRKNTDKHDEAEGDQDEDRGEYSVDADVGSSVGPDYEDSLRGGSMRATSLTSKTSDASRQHSLPSHRSSAHFGTFVPPGQNDGTEHSRFFRRRLTVATTPSSLPGHADELSFFLDNESFEVDHKVDPFEVPPLEDAEHLLKTYMGHCHESFPILAKKAFTQQFYHYYAAVKRGKPYSPSLKWQTQLNLVFAIAAMRSHLIAAEWRRDEHDHLIYHSRALALSEMDPWWFSRQDLPQMQITGLLSFYCLITGHINRSWVLSGMALRLGYTLGLHTYNASLTTGPANKETLSRVWWGHYALDTMLATLTGRPSIGVNKVCSVPLPLPLSSEDIEDDLIKSRYGDAVYSANSIHTRMAPPSNNASPNSPDQMIHDRNAPNLDPANSGSFLKSMVQLGEIAQDALGMYTEGSTSQPWQGVPEAIVGLTDGLKAWTESLPDAFRFSKPTAYSRPFNERERNILDITYHSTVILITRPCLCRLDRRVTNQPARLNEFNQSSAVTCVESAKAVARLLPDSPELDIALLYEAGPWWVMPYTITQSLVVLLLELSYEEIQLPHDRREIIFWMKKLVRWLRAMRINNGLAQRAYVIVMNLLRVLIVTVKMDITDLFQEDDKLNAAVAAAQTRLPMPLTTSPTSTVPGYPMQFDQPQGRRPSILSQLAGGEGSQDQGRTRSPSYQSLNSASRSERTNDSANAFVEFFADLQGMSRSAFPSFFFTKYDEQNPLPGFGGEDHAMSGIEFQTPRTTMPSVANMPRMDSQREHFMRS